MKSFYTLSLILTLMTLSSAQAQPAMLRGIYIDNFSQILGNSVKEDSLLHYAQDSSFNYLALYELQAINFSNASKVSSLASFIRRARENYGVQYVGAVCESYSSFQSDIGPYNNGRTNPNEKFNVFNIEFEFWIGSSVNPGAYYCTRYLTPNGCSCDTSGAFKFYIDQVRKIDSLAAIQGALSETYVGWFNQGQGKQMAQYLDRILLHAYRTDPSSVFGYSKTRLSYLASLGQQVDVVPIFSSEPDFMGPWLNSHSMNDAYTQYQADFSADNSSWKPYIRLLGYQWFDYGFMPKPVPGTPVGFTPTLSASGVTSFCSGGSVTLTASAGSSYLWSTGATTSSIVVNSSGSYNCQVTQNGVTGTTSAMTVTVNAPPTSGFAVASSALGSVVLNSTSTAGSGVISSYQWYYNGNSIGGATANTYTASSDGDYSLRVINSNGCNHTSSVQGILIPVGTCQLSTPGGCASMNLSPTSVMVSWNNVQPCDSIIVRYKKEGTNTYNYIRLPYTGNNVSTITNVVPNARYSWRVKTSCGSNYGNYSEKQYFTILSSQITAAYSPEIRNKNIPVDTKIDTEELTIYPNPAREHIRMTFFSKSDGQGETRMIDISGRVVANFPVYIVEGDNSLEVNTSKLPSGSYLISLQTVTMNLMKRVLIQN